MADRGLSAPMQDSSISMNEIKVNNSGIPQGRFLKRSKVAKDSKGTLFSATDFRIGELPPPSF